MVDVFTVEMYSDQTLDPKKLGFKGLGPDPDLDKFWQN